jgi:hypothetical protein
MTDRPILFSAPMVRALLAGTKTQTRRLAKFVRREDYSGNLAFSGIEADCLAPGLWALVSRGAGGCWNERTKQLRTYKPGDRLWVRESWWHVCAADGATVTAPGTSLGRDAAFFVADHPDYPPCPHYRKRPGIYMPRWASRLTLTVTDVSVQRLQSIGDEDAVAEGLERAAKHADRCMTPAGDYAVPRVAFQRLWDHINGKRAGAAWADNPWIVAITFTVAHRNIDDTSTKPASVDTSSRHVDGENTTEPTGAA